MQNVTIGYYFSHLTFNVFKFVFELPEDDLMFGQEVIVCIFRLNIFLSIFVNIIAYNRLIQGLWIPQS
jgi:hypothetical protein